MKLRQTLDINLEQKLTHKELLEQRIEISQKMRLEIEDIRNESGFSPENLLEDVIRILLQEINEESLKNALDVLLKDETLKEKLIENCGALAMPTKEKIENFVLNYIYDSNRGDFRIEETNEEGKGIINSLKTTSGDFFLAIKNPAEAEKRAQDLESLIKTGKGAGEGAMEELHEMKNAIEIAVLVKPNFELLQNAVTYLLKKTNSAGEPILVGFLKDAAIISKIGFLVSERIQKRFVRNFSAIKQKESSQKFENAFLNSVGEYVLVSMGVIAPEIFALNKTELDPKAYEAAKVEFDKLGLNLDALKKQYNLRSEGTLFWNRWKTLEKKPDKITDENIRKFITETVRADSEKILEVIKYENLFEKIKDVVLEMKGKDKQDERENELRELLTESFSSSDFKDILLELIREKWYEKLDIFYSHDI